MTKKKKNKFATILSLIVVLLLVFGFVGLLVFFTDNFDTDLKRFYVRCGNDVIVADRDKFSIKMNEEYKFFVGSELEDLTGNTEYVVSVIPNITSSTIFTFKANDTAVNFEDVASLTKGFEINVYDEYFTFKATKDLKDILQMYYKGQTLTDVPTYIDSDLSYISLVVQSKKSEDFVRINLVLKSEK